MKGLFVCSIFSLLQWSLCCFLVTVIAFSSADVATNKTDLSALLSFKSLITDDPLGVLSAWNDSLLDYCKWQGIVCGRRHPNRVIALVLNSTQLSGQISPSLANLTFLQVLNLSNNKLTGSILKDLGRLSRMRYVNLSFNSLNGMIPQLHYNCSYLEFLSLDDNELQGAIPSDLAQCKNLQVISVSKNLLVGSIPSEFGSLHKLTFLVLYQNNLTGIIPQNLGNLTNLKDLDLSHNSLSGSIPMSLGKLQHLNKFLLGFNMLSGKIPNFIYNLSSVELLSIASNQLEGILPQNMCDSLPNLQRLLIYKTQLKGKIPTSISNCSTLTKIELDYNNLTGTIPSTIGKLKNLIFFKVNHNQLEAQTPVDWSFIDAITNCTSLQHLELGANQLQGIIPSAVANLSTNLQYLGLYQNPIFGTIPSEIGRLTNLTVLHLDMTYLTGAIPNEIGYLWKLQELYLYDNSLSGKMPSTFGNLTRMNQLYLYNNAFEGSIPVELRSMKNLENMSFEYNKFIGSIPKEIMDLSTAISIDFSSNYLTGSLPSEIGNLKNLVNLSLSNNKLSGTIPNTIAGCQLLQILCLDRNMFEGIIPSSLRNMRGLQVLNLSNNSFTGQVPEFLANMSLQYLDISFNHFEGKLPEEGIFKNTSQVNVRGNLKLCGGIPEFYLHKCPSASPTKRNHYQKIMIITFSIFGGLLSLTIIVCILFRSYLRKRSQRNPQINVDMKSQYMNISYNDIFRGTQGFSNENIVGTGTFGVVYKANILFENVLTIVAIKVVNLEQHGAFRSFIAECEALRYIRHRNLIKVLGLCSSIDHKGNDFKAFVFEFMPNGNLEAWLHPNACVNRPFRSLNIIQRLNIAIDVAIALNYLHDHGPVPIVHCDLKPCNILLDDNMTAHVGDFGLARFLVQPDTMTSQSITSRIKGSIGYIPPEYGMGCQVSVQGDMYSYGILLLEMFTGVSPTDERFENGSNLYTYVQTTFPENIMEIIDTKLFSKNNEATDHQYAPENIDDCLVSVVRCGLQCCKELPKERIEMKEVVKELNLARAKLLN